jgi:hypothetical protein
MGPQTEATGTRRSHAGRPRHPDRQPSVRRACGHARYTKGCDSCALTGIYQDHLSWPGITPAERLAVTRLYQLGDKAGLFKLWQAWRQDDRP